MWRKVPISVIVLVALAYPAFSQRTPRAGGGTDPKQAEFLAKLVGCSVTIRIYPSASDPNGTYVLIDIPLGNGNIWSSNIKAAYPSISWSSLVVVWAPDQADPVVADSLGRSVWAQSYSDGLRLSLFDLAVEREKIDPSWTIVDARGEPIPGASVTVYAYLGHYRIEMLLGQNTTNDRGQFQRCVPHGEVSILLKVEHPNYGTAIVEYIRPEDDRAGIYWVSLVPLDSEAAALGIQGTIRDQYGNPVAGAIVKCTSLWQSGSEWERFHGGVFSQAVTNQDGWFSLCVARLTQELQWKGLPHRWALYEIEISPPQGSNLGVVFRLSLLRMRAGSRRTFVLAPKDLPKSFHTFSFEYAECAAPGREYAEKTTLVFLRNGFEWERVGNDKWRNGCSLPSGVLRAVVERWPGEEFWFQEIEVNETSPRHLVFKSSPAIRYRGQVVDGATGKPMPEVLVAVGRISERWEGPSLTDELSQQFQAQAAGEPTDQGPPLHYKAYNRVARTDARGLYEFTLMPGVAPSLDEFTAVAPNRLRSSITASSLAPDAEGIIILPEIEVPASRAADGFTGFVFEDENGPVTDPDRLKNIKIEVRTPDGRGYAGRFEDFRKNPEFIAGAYRAEVIWNGTYYTFEPVDLSEGAPAIVVFRPETTTPADVTCTGRVVHGTTGEPITGAVVVYNRMPGGGDLSSLTPEQWAAIDALEETPDVADPALTPLLRLLIPPTASVPEAIPQVVRTDAEGRFSMRWRPEPFTRRADCLLAFAKDFLGAQQQLTYLASPDGDPATRAVLHRLEPDANGVIAIRPMLLFPAGTVLLHPVVPTSGDQEEARRLVLTLNENSMTPVDPWPKDLTTRPGDHKGAGVYCPHSIRPNTTQSIHILADVPNALWLCMQSPGALPPIRKNIWVKQGKVFDFGHLEFQPGVNVVLHLVDSKNRGVGGACLEYEDEYWHVTQRITDAQGLAQATLAPHWSGAILLRYGDAAPQNVVFFLCTIGGQEDAGTTFVLNVPDSVLAFIPVVTEN